MTALRMLAILALTFAACTLPDPVHDRAVEALGPEGPEGAGPNHRPGTRCGLCHNGTNGPASTDFSIAGTIYKGPTNLTAIEGARVLLVDSLGTSPPASKPITTNAAGNFWVPRNEWNPVFPVRVKVTKGAAVAEMRSDIGRAASCADCHEAKAPVPNPFTKDGPVWIDETASAPDGGADGGGP